MHYLITITQAGGMSDTQLQYCEEWVESLNVKCIASREEHKSGLLHFHAIVEDSNARANGLKRKLMRALDEKIDFSHPRALDVQSVKKGTEKTVAGYVCKDRNIFVHQGWSIKSLLAERAELLKQDVTKKPVATYMLNEKNAEEIILEFAKRTTMPLTTKQEFIAVMCNMAVEGYSVSRIKPMVVYAQVMARAGSPEYMRDWWEMKLGGQM